LAPRPLEVQGYKTRRPSKRPKESSVDVRPAWFSWNTSSYSDHRNALQHDIAVRLFSGCQVAHFNNEIDNILRFSEDKITICA
jgi:hypothetical protein